MRIGSAMDEFAKLFPDRFYDVAIAEQHALVLASGLAAGGMHPVVAIYSSFLQRAYDSVIHDVAIQDLPIVLAIDRAGVVGPDGPTHQGAFDIAYLRTVPNLTLLAPATRDELNLMLDFALALGHPCAVRYPRMNGWQSLTEIAGPKEEPLVLGKSQILYDPHKPQACAVIAVGAQAAELLPYAKEQGFILVNLRFIKPLDTALLATLAARCATIVTVEDGALLGGVGEEIGRILLEHGFKGRFKALGLPDVFLMEGTRAEVLADAGLTAKQICAQLTALELTNSMNKEEQYAVI